MRSTLTLLALLALASLPPSLAAATVRVVATTPTLAAIAREVGGDRVEVESMARPDEDPHFVTPKPSFMVKLRKADLFVQVGMELEIGWAPPLLTGCRNARIQPGAAGFVDASIGIAPLEVPVAASRAEGDVHPQGNPHYWLDPANAEIVARNVAAGLARVDPDGAAEYEQRRAAFTARLRERLAGWSARLEPWRDREVVSYHRLWPYLSQRFGLRFAAEVEPKPGIPPGPKHLSGLADLMTARGIRLIVQAPYCPTRSVEALARRVGGRSVVLPVEPGAAGADDTILGLYDRLVDLLAAELQATSREAS